jgi:hypothetical protein
LVHAGLRPTVLSRISWLALWAAAVASPSVLAQGPPPGSDDPPKVVLRGAQVVDLAIPTVFAGDLRDLPLARAWQPGDPIHEVPRRRHHPPPVVPPPAVPQRDPLLDVQARVPLRGLDPPILNFDGQNFTGSNPPDTVGDVGLEHYVQAVNSGSGAIFTVYDKTDGTVAAGPIAIESLGTGNCAIGRGDPIVLYDQLADRWLLSEFSFSGFRLCLYVSQTSDPISGGWFAYQLEAPNFPDYPKYGVWPDAYYVSTNENPLPAVYAMDRAQMLVGGVATIQRFTAPNLGAFPFEALIPADADGEAPPPLGTPNPFMRHRDDEAHNPPGTPGQDFLEIWELHVDWTTPANSTFTGPTNLAIAEIDSHLCGLTAFFCFPQPAGPTLDPLREVVMHRLQYRNFGSHQTLVGNLVTDVDGTDHGGIRWFELRDTGAGWALHQEGTFAPDAHHRWMGSAAMDGSGNLAIGYSISSATQSPSLRFAARLAGDPFGTLQGEVDIVDGTAGNASNRWGDYAALTVDPVDDSTFWFTSMYSPASSWATRIAAFKVCVPPGTPAIGTATAAAPNRIDVTWSGGAPGADSYKVYRAQGTCAAPGPFVAVADAVPGFLYQDTTVSGGTSYAYRLTGFLAACESAVSGCVEAVATGACTLAPTFSGLVSVANARNAGCALDLSWTVASSQCAAGVTYNVYRSTSPGFTPGAGNRVATGVTGTTYRDNVALDGGQTYYYVVRAVDAPSGTEDANVVRKSAAPTGPFVPASLTDTFEGALSGGGFDLPGWIHFATIGAQDWIPSTAQSQSPTHSWQSPSIAATSGRVLVSPPFGAAASTALSFWHTFAFDGNVADCLDAGTLEVSTDGGTTWTVLPDAAFTAGGFNGTASACCFNPIGGKRAWCGGTIGPMTQVTANLSAYAGQVVKVRWQAGDDFLTNGTGWLVDSFQVSNAELPTACIVDGLFYDGFETGLVVPPWGGASP